MMNSLNNLTRQSNELITQILKSRNPALLSELMRKREPTHSERLEVLNILSDEFTKNLLPNSEPTQRGRDIDNLLGSFLLLWPI